MGVIVSLSTAKEQINGLKKVQTDLEGKIRTATSEEEKIELQEKVDNIAKSISDRIKETTDIISDHAEPEKETESKNENEIKEEIKNESEISQEDKDLHLGQGKAETEA